MNYSKFYSSTLLFAGSLLTPIYADNDTVEKINEEQTNLVATEPKEAKTSLTRLAVRQGCSYLLFIFTWFLTTKNWCINIVYLIDLILRIGTIYCYRADFTWAEGSLYKYGSNISRTFIFWPLFVGTEIITGSNPFSGETGEKNLMTNAPRDAMLLITFLSIVSLVWHYFIELIDHFIIAIFIPYEEATEVKKEEQPKEEAQQAMPEA